MKSFFKLHVVHLEHEFTQYNWNSPLFIYRFTIIIKTN